MSSTYDWPNFGVASFEMRISHNTRAFISPFSSTSQVLNYTGERWAISLALTPGNSVTDGAAKEAFFDRLYGPANRVRLWNLRRPHPLGTLRDGVTASVVNGSLAAVNVVNASAAAVTVVAGTPVLAAAVAVGASTATIQTIAGRTLKAGDHIGLPNGQNVRQMVDATADGNGLLPVEFQPRARTAMAQFGAITWDKPKADFMLRADGPSITWRPGMHESVTAEFVEAF